MKIIFVGVTGCFALNCAVAQDRMPRIPEEKMTDAQREAVKELSK